MGTHLCGPIHTSFFTTVLVSRKANASVVTQFPDINGTLLLSSKTMFYFVAHFVKVNGTAEKCSHPHYIFSTVFVYIMLDF